MPEPAAGAPRGVLVTRPEPEAAETAARLRAAGWRPVLAPSLRIAPRTVLLPHAFRPAAVVVTSGNALAPLPAAVRDAPLFAVGDATAARAAALGFTRIRSAGGDAARLERLIAATLPPAGTLLLASGAGQGRALASALRLRGFRVLHRVAYAAHPVPGLPDAAGRAMRAGAVGWALYFSAASARAGIAALRRAGLGGAVGGTVAVAMSAATRAALCPLPWRSIRVASRPDQDELLACLK